MKYSNPEIPEGINVSNTHPLSEFMLLVVGVFTIMSIVLLTLVFITERIVQYIPFEYESKITLNYPVKDYKDEQLQQYLQAMADKISVAEDLPRDMQVRVRIVDDEGVNAFASLGGQLVFSTGILKKIPNENALAMVIAHEIAHIKHRHPIRSFGGGIILELAFSVLNNSLGSDVVSSSVGDVEFVSQLKFSRDQEQEADITALAALGAIYGHVNGADDLFLILKQEAANDVVPELFSTHPNTDSRLKRIEHDKRTNTSTEAIILPLPNDYASWLAGSVGSIAE